MAASTARNSSRARPPLINLAASDEEEGQRGRRRMHRNHSVPSLAVEISVDPYVSNHGLLLPRTFDQREGSFLSHRKTISENNHRVRYQVSKTAQPLRYACSTHPSISSSKGDGILPSNTNPTTNRVPAGQSLRRSEIQDQNANYINFSDAATGVKRRKIFHKGAVTRDPSASAASPSGPAATEHKVQLVEASVKSSPPFPLANNIVGRASQSLPGNVRSRVNRGGRIQKPKHQFHRDMRLLAIERSERMVQVLRNQVFKHIKAAIRRYDGRLTNMDRTAIGTKTAGKLVEDASFAENFTANDWKLSLDYERILSSRAQVYVDKYAEEILNGVGNVLRDTYNNTAQHQLVHCHSPRPDIQLLEDHANVVETSFNSSSTSDEEDDDQIFEGEYWPHTNLSSPSHHPIPRQYSSSPTTSFSNDFISGTVQWDEEIEASIPAVKVPNSRDHKGQSKPSGQANCLTGERSLPGGLEGSLDTKSHSTLRKDRSEDRSFRDGNVRGVQGLLAAGLDGEFPRPYTNFTNREEIRCGCKTIARSCPASLADTGEVILQKPILHLDFCLEEIELVSKLIMGNRRGRRPAKANPREQIISLMTGQTLNIPRIVRLLEEEIRKPGPEPGRTLLRSRGTSAITTFLKDAGNNSVTMNSKLIRLQKRSPPRFANTEPSISMLLRQRETWGMAPVMICRGQKSFETKISSSLEDSLDCQSEWTNCCGDISAVSWTSENAFICGATAHSDNHNMQYNKPGNLAVGSSSFDTLKAVADHRIRRPVINIAENAVNALDSMRQTQDPWLYTSVVSTSYSEITKCAFTASFDRTVKVWAVSEDGSSMNLLGSWEHDGKVNFVVTSENHERVATASDVSNDAIRVYNFDESNIPGTPFDTYNGEKAKEQALELRRRDTWAYFPATIQWGRAELVKDLLLVGYSPRSVTGNETDIPDEKRNSGELCLWNASEGCRVPISSAKTQNVFEVIWHPSQPMFLAATSPCGTFEPETKTQVRLFGLNELGAFVIIKALDCPGSDINELTLMPNSNMDCYVTASCTDGNTYVWDTAQGDEAIHVLSHGDSVDNPTHDLPREVADTGVKFASWGKTSDRFYSGASDGKVKVWDIRAAQNNAFVQNILEVSGGISAGAFSSNFSKLVIGDATGKVHLLGIDDNDLEEGRDADVTTSSTTSLRRLGTLDALPRSVKRPKPIIPHPEPPLPEGGEMEIDEDEQTGSDIARLFVEEGQLVLLPDRKIGAVQGPNYRETQLYRCEAHEGSSGAHPLLPEWQRLQQCELRKQDETLRISLLPQVRSSLPALHTRNVALDFDLSQLSLEGQEDMRRDCVELDWDDHMFEYEMFPRTKIFRDKSRHER